jgi:hypothetical protein
MIILCDKCVKDIVVMSFKYGFYHEETGINSHYRVYL